MAQLELVWDKRDLAYWRNRVPEKALVRALKLSGTDAIRRLRAASKRLIRARKKIKAKYLADRVLPLRMPRSPKTITDLVWAMDVSDIPVPLSEFPRRQTKEGVKVQVNVSGGFKLIKSAFLAMKTSSGGGKGVFLRPTKARYPMGHRLGPSVGDMFAYDKRLAPDAFAEAQAVFERSFDRLLAIELKKQS
jgi:hypothetical protein